MILLLVYSSKTSISLIVTYILTPCYIYISIEDMVFIWKYYSSITTYIYILVYIYIYRHKIIKFYYTGSILLVDILYNSSCSISSTLF